MLKFIVTEVQTRTKFIVPEIGYEVAYGVTKNNMKHYFMFYFLVSLGSSDKITTEEKHNPKNVQHTHLIVK